MIEKDIKDISKAHKKIDKTLKEISHWQIVHEKEDDVRQEQVMEIIKSLPTTELITETIERTIKVVVNGKIDDVKKHLTQQDTLQLEMQIAIKDLTDKVTPLDNTKNWFWSFGKGIVYIGAISAAIVGFIKLLQALNILK